MTSRKHIQLIFLLVKASILKPEASSPDKGKNTYNAIIPHQQGVCGKSDEGLANGGRDGGHEQVESHNKRTHVAGSFGEGVFKRGDGGENLRHRDKDIGAGLSPNIDAGGFTISSMFSASAVFVDVGLDHARPYHGRSASVETTGDLLDGGKVDAGFAEGRIDEKIADRDENDERKWIQVGEDVVGEPVQFHDGCLRSQVVVELVVGNPVKWIPAKDGAGGETPSDFIYPLIIKRHPVRSLSCWDVAGFGSGPKGAIVHVLPRSNRVHRPSALLSEEPDLHGLAENAALGWCENVNFAAKEHDGRTDAKHEGGEEIREPEADIFLRVDHGELTHKSPDVDEQVEPHVDTGGSHGGINNDPLSLLICDDFHVGKWKLFSNEW